MFYAVLGVLAFFVTFYRLSLFFPNLYLAILPSFFGILLLLSQITKNDKILKVNTLTSSFIILTLFLFIYCIVIDLFQPVLTLSSSLSFRILTIIFFSLLPAYFISQKIIKFKPERLEKIVYFAFILQLLFFFLTYLNPNIKTMLFSIFGMSESVLLEDDFLQLRAFGLSAEINFMSPFLMVFLSFILFSKKGIFKFIVILTQILNSNLVIIAVALGWLAQKTKIYSKVFALVLIYLIYNFAGESLIQQYFPRFYSEFIAGNKAGTSTTALLNDHIFLVGKLDISTFLFGFQQNVSSAAGVSNRISDIGWVILFNYGGIIIVLLFTSILFLLSNLIFREKKFSYLWFLIGLIFNSKGMIIGLNGYFFISFLFLFTKYFNPNVVK